MTGDELRAMRARFGMTREEFAALLRVKPPSVLRWETGERRITEHTALLLRLLDAHHNAQKNICI